MFAHIPKSLRQKFDKKSMQGIFVGYDCYSKGYRVYFPNQNKVGVYGDVVFGNEISSVDNKASSNDKGGEASIVLNEQYRDEQNVLSQEQDVINFDQQSHTQEEERSEGGLNLNQAAAEEERECSNQPFLTEEDEHSSGQAPEEMTGNKSRYYLRSRGNVNIDDLFVIITNEDEPITYQDAMKSKYAKSWKMAMDEEYESLIKN